MPSLTQSTYRLLVILSLICALLFALNAYRQKQPPTTEHAAAQTLGISVLSTRPDMVSGGDARVRIDSSGIGLGTVRVVLNDVDISAAFTPTHDGLALEGVVENLHAGSNTLVALDGAGNTRSQITLRNHPLTGPVMSGPHQQPFVCSTQQAGLGEALDADCSAVTRVSYFYRNLAGEFHPIDDITSPYPDDMSSTIVANRPLPYLVRVESGTRNRAIYHLALLDDPQRTYGEWDAMGWNHRLAFSFGEGCGGLHRQDSRSLDTVLDDAILRRGFAHVVSSFTGTGLPCNDSLAAETLMMLKEHFIENYGQPYWTLGLGGGTQQLLIAQNYPGLLDGLLASSSLPDALSSLPGSTDCRLLTRYFDTATQPWNPQQRQAVEAYAAGSCAVWEQAAVDAIVAAGDCAIPRELQYDSIANPTGVRCTIYDGNIASLGRDPETGFAYQTLDNVGVQYGLEALQTGLISPAHFIELNTQIGGFDRDGKAGPLRSHAQLTGLEGAYRSGRINQGTGGLARVPILQLRAYSDTLGGISKRLHDFQIRARLRKASNTAAHQVIWVYPTPEMAAQIGELALDTMSQWLDRLQADHSEAPFMTRILNAQPETATDACWTAQGQRIDEAFEFMDGGRCSTLYPEHRNPRLAAGAPLEDDVLKCVLRTAQRGDYSVQMTDAQWQALQAAFPEGVCDYAVAGQGQLKPAGTFLRLPL